MKKAETVTSEFYCIRPREWNRFPFDVLTSLDLPRSPERQGVLAEVRRSVQKPVSSRKSHSIREFYTILLRDANILKMVEERGRHFDLENLLVYVLTHEIIHVVRFLNQSAPFFMDRRRRRIEEMKVTDITSKTLEVTKDGNISYLISHFHDFCEINTEHSC